MDFSQHLRFHEWSGDSKAAGEKPVTDKRCPTSAIYLLDRLDEIFMKPQFSPYPGAGATFRFSK